MRRYLTAVAVMGLLCSAPAMPSRAQTSPAKSTAKAGTAATLPLIDLAGYKRLLEKYRANHCWSPFGPPGANLAATSSPWSWLSPNSTGRKAYRSSA